MKKTVYIAHADDIGGDMWEDLVTFDLQKAISEATPWSHEYDKNRDHYVAGHHIDCAEGETAQEAWNRFLDEGPDSGDPCYCDPDIYIPCNYGTMTVDGRDYALNEKPYYDNGVFHAKAICIEEEVSGYNTVYNITWKPEEAWLHRDDEDFDGEWIDDKYACDWYNPDSAELIKREMRIM